MSKDIQTWYIADQEGTTIEAKEKTLLNNFINYIKKEQPDIWFSWNVKFDYQYLHNRIKNFAKLISPIGLSRRGDEENIYFPCGISIVDYLQLFKKIYMREASYALDYIAEKHLGKGKKHKNVDFSKLSAIIPERNRGDVEIMVELENKFKIVSYYDEIRRMTKCQWEDLYFNSRLVEYLLLEEAKNKQLVLPNKQRREEDADNVSFQGATRDVDEVGVFHDVGKLDLTSAYPSMIVNFCLDTQNILGDGDEDEFEMYGGININGVYFRQNSEALLPTIVTKILKLKDDLKKLKKSNPSKENDIKYDAIKAIVNSTFGVMGSPYFRLFNIDVASTITFLVRDLLMYVKSRVEAENIKVLYWDTDSTFLSVKEDVSAKLNQYIKDWAKEKYGKDDINLKFEYEGYFTSIIMLGKCLDPRTRIKTEKGFKDISKLYREKYRGKVFCLNNQGNLVLSTVNNIITNSLRNRKLYKIILKHNRKSPVGSCGGIFTEDHKLLTNNGWKEIKNLSNQDLIHSGYLIPNNELYEAWIGSFLGDGYISKGAMFHIGHCFKQKAYCWHKADLFSMTKKIKKACVESYTLANPWYRKQRLLLYKESKKQINDEIINNYSIISLAYHFVDDGWMCKKRQCQSSLRLNTFSNEEILKLSNKIKKLGIDNSILKTKTLLFNSKNTKILSEKIAPYVIKEMNYKILPEHRSIKKHIIIKTYKPFFDSFYLKEYQPIQNVVYDIEVDKYHNFLTLSGIAHNCHYYGYLNGKDKPEIKGIEAKRSSSSKFEAKFQEALLNHIINGETREDLVVWINQERERIKDEAIEDISFPCKITNKKYKNYPIFMRAFDNTKKIKKDFKVNVGELFWYIFTKDSNQVLSFTRDDKDFIKRNNIDWERVVERNIISKAQNIFESLKWNLPLNLKQDSLF